MPLSVTRRAHHVCPTQRTDTDAHIKCTPVLVYIHTAVTPLFPTSYTRSTTWKCYQGWMLRDRWGLRVKHAGSNKPGWTNPCSDPTCPYARGAKMCGKLPSRAERLLKSLCKNRAAKLPLCSGQEARAAARQGRQGRKLPQGEPADSHFS